MIGTRIPLFIILVACLAVRSGPKLEAANGQSPIILGLGDSIGEGVQSADTNAVTQTFSYLNLFTLWLGNSFDLPLIRSSFFATVGDAAGR